MSALCQKQTFCAAVELALFDHFVGAGEKRRWHLKAECPRGLEIDRQPEFRWLLDGQVSRFSAFQNPVYVIGHATEQIGQVRPVGHQSSRLYKLLNVIEGRQPLLCRPGHDARSLLKKKVGPGSRRERSLAGYPSWQDWLRPHGPRAHPKSAASPPRSGTPPADASAWIASRDWRYSPA